MRFLQQSLASRTVLQMDQAAYADQAFHEQQRERGEDAGVVRLFEENSGHPCLLDQLKQLGFYTDCLGKARWSLPAAAISRELAESLVETAHLLAGSSTGECTTREIELWVEHVGPVWRQDLGWMKQAAINWYAAMQEAGLKPKGDNTMEQFVRVGIPPVQASNDADVQRLRIDRAKPRSDPFVGRAREGCPAVPRTHHASGPRAKSRARPARFKRWRREHTSL
jgi:hypothetical protein